MTGDLASIYSSSLGGAGQDSKRQLFALPVSPGQPLSQGVSSLAVSMPHLKLLSPAVRLSRVKSHLFQGSYSLGPYSFISFNRSLEKAKRNGARPRLHDLAWLGTDLRFSTMSGGKEMLEE